MKRDEAKGNLLPRECQMSEQIYKSTLDHFAKCRTD